MYLLDVETYKLCEFQGIAIPKYKYAILSHVWGEGEVSFQDLQAGKGPSKQGYEKITLTCKQAHRDGFKWAWIDTCCIDKTSSAELSEAINSMYQCYKDSTRCYAYLSDVDEELIAPSWIIFYGRGWKDIGRCDGPIARIVSIVTRVPEPLILGNKMSWATYRRSTRPEDIAYSLLGLFDINMPLLYGEGDRKGFFRLQEEILRGTDDHSLLCWTVPKSSHRAWTLQSVLATSPDDFAKSGEIKGHLLDPGVPSAVTNRGLQIRLCLTERLYNESSHLYNGNVACSVYDAAMNAAECQPGRHIYINQMSIILIRTPQVSRGHAQSFNRYARLATPTLGRISMDYYTEILEAAKTRAEVIYIHKTLFDWEQDRFGEGGVHLQNISIVRSLCPLSKKTEGSDQDHDLKIKSVLYSGLEDVLCDLSSGVPANPEGGVTWSPFYGCIKFEFPLRRAPATPYFVIFRIGPPSDEEERSYILIAWNEDYIHFSIQRSKSQMLNVFLKYQNKLNGFRREERIMRLADFKEAPPALIMPTDSSTRRGNCWKMYGEIARTRATIGDYDTELILEREDPNTEDGEAAEKIDSPSEMVPNETQKTEKKIPDEAAGSRSTENMSIEQTA
ncbi:HET-domain-containing protein [Hypoxylon sp. FL0890]|nr:HET-domain-containing protein [Hypoxylon sp. FL0890]